MRLNEVQGLSIYNPNNILVGDNLNLSYEEV